MKTIGILGAGFSGTMVAVHLMRNANKPLHIYLIEKAVPGRGLAYADIDSSLLLNVRADQMGAFPDQVGHFYEWLQNHHYNVSGEDFVQRKIYGDYLQELLEDAIAKCKGMVKVTVIKDKAINVTAERKMFFFAFNLPIYVDEIVLAMGLHSPAEFSMTTIKSSNEPITILGSGLSMVDVVVYLASINYTGKIIVVSRRGKIPQVHKFFDPTVPRPVYQFSESDSLMSVFKKIRRDCEQYDWRLVIDAVRPHVAFLWQKFSKKEKGQFLRYLRPYWDTRRHRLSPLHQKILDNLMAKGQLEIKAVGFRPYKPQTKTVVKCHGLSTLKNNFIQKLIAKELVVTDEYKLGIESQKEWVHVIGPLRRGELWETTAVPEIRAQASELALKLLA